MTELWRDPEADVDERVADLVSRMTLVEKVGQLSGVWWLDPDAGGMAPMLRESVGPLPSWEEVVADGLGQLTRTFGTAPLEPIDGMGILAERQRDVMAANRFGIPALAHEECLTGLAAWRATIYPSPLCWAATFDPDLVAADGRPDRRVDARARDPPRAGAGARRRPRPAVGARRGDHGRGPVPGRRDRQRLRPRTRVRGDRGDPQALPRLLRLPGGAQPRPGGHGSARARRRLPAAVRDGTAGRCPVGDELLHGHRRACRPPPTRAC